MSIDESETMILRTNEGEAFLAVCVAVLLFYNVSSSPESRAALLEIFDDHTAMTGDVYKWTQNPNTSKWKSLKSGRGSYTLPREWVPDAGRRWNFIYHAGTKNYETSDIKFSTFNTGDMPDRSKCNYVLLQFPASAVLEGDVSSFIGRICKWCSALRPIHGYAGLNFARPHAYFPYESATLYRLSQKFLGVDICDPILHTFNLADSIKGADWLTILSDEYINRLGGFASVKSKMGELNTISYEGGGILQATNIPQFITPEQEQPFRKYAQIASIIEPIRKKDYGGFARGSDTGEAFTKERYNAWLARFSNYLD